MEAKKNGETQVVVFVLEQEEFACNIADVREVLKMVRVTPLPRTLDFIEGVINLRGEVIPILDLRRRFGLPKVERTGKTRIVIVENLSRMVGLIVDSVSEVVRLPEKEIQEPPDQVAGSRTNLIAGVGKIDERLLIILNLEQILNTEEQIDFDEISAAGRQLVSAEEAAVIG